MKNVIEQIKMDMLRQLYEKAIVYSMHLVSLSYVEICVCYKRWDARLIAPSFGVVYMTVYASFFYLIESTFNSTQTSR